MRRFLEQLFCGHRYERMFQETVMYLPWYSLKYRLATYDVYICFKCGKYKRVRIK